MNKILFFKILIFIAIAGLFTLPAIAQKEKTIGVDKDGEFHLRSPKKLAI